MAKIRYAEVRNIMDPWESGRVQLRIYGHHDNEEKVKDDDLPWALPIQDITSAATERVGTSPTGLLVGSRVLITYAEDDVEEQYPIIMGSYGRAGKGKDTKDNTGGYDDVDDKYGDAPIGQYGSPRMTPKTNTQSKTVAGSQKRDPKAKPKYNNVPHVSESDGTDVLKAAKEKFAADLGNLPTVASIDKKSIGDMLGMIQKVDPQNLSAILPQAVTNLQKIIQIGNMTSPGGITNLTGNVLGNVFKSVASNLGLGSLVGQLGGALGIPGIPGGAPGISGIAGVISNVTGAAGTSGLVNGLTVVSNAIGGVPIQGILTQSQTSHSTPAQLPLQTQVGNISATLLNQLGGHEPPNDYVAQLDDNSKQALYLGLLELLNSTRDDLTVDPPITRSSDGTCVIPSEYIVTTVPDGYLQVFSFTDEDPYPGYIKWTGSEAEIVFTVRPADRPYSPTPSEDCINAGVQALKEDLFDLVRAGKLDLEKLLALLGITRAKVEETGTENTLGSGINLQNIMSFATKLLGLLGTNITSAISNHISGGSVLEEAAKKAVEGYTKKFAVARAQKPSGKKVVDSKQPDIGNIPAGLLSFASTASGWVNPQDGVVPATTIPTPIPNSAMNTTPKPGAFIPPSVA